MAAVTLLTSGAQDKSGAGAAVDVSSYGALRLDATFTYDAGGPPWAQLRFLIEDAPTADGPWRIIEERRYCGRAEVSGFSANPFHVTKGFPNRDHFVLAGFDNFARVRWENLTDRDADESLVMGVAGTGV